MPTQLITQPTGTPTRKVGAAGIAGAIVTLIVAGAQALGVEIGPDLAGALVVAISTAAGYLIRERATG